MDAETDRSANVPVMKAFAGKIVYTTDMDMDTAPFREDCERMGGEFNECGDVCPPGADMCAQVCAYTCELGGNIDKSKAPPSLPQGFSIAKVIGIRSAGDFAGPDGLGNFWIARPEAGAITLVSTDESGNIQNISNVFEGMDYPGGLALAPGERMILYYAHSGALYRAKLYTDAKPERLAEVPSSDTDVAFGPDGRLYVHSGGKVMVLEESGRLSDYAPGPQGPGGLAVDPLFGRLWAAGEDGAYVISPGSAELRAEFPKRCGKAAIDFVPEEGWPAGMRLDLMAACSDSGELLLLDLNDERKPGDISMLMVRDWLPEDLDLMPGGIMRITDSAGGSLITIGREMEDRTEITGPRVDDYSPGMIIESPAVVTGEAPGTWYFEGRFSASLLNNRGEVLDKSPVKAKAEWMQEGPVPFEIRFKFEKPETEKGWLVLEKANPSGIPKKDDELRLEIAYEQYR